MASFQELRSKARLTVAETSDFLGLEVQRVLAYENGEVIPAACEMQALKGLALLAPVQPSQPLPPILQDSVQRKRTNGHANRLDALDRSAHDWYRFVLSFPPHLVRDYLHRFGTNAETICLQERLPPGAAAVLINRNHTYTDLLMTISATEKRLFDAIDGSRTIGDILGIGVPSWQEELHLDMARTFFERLWWHDQVVFDATRRAVSPGPVVAHRSSDDNAAFSTIATSGAML